MPAQPTILKQFKAFLEEIPSSRPGRKGLSKVSIKNYLSDVRQFLAWLSDYSDLPTASVQDKLEGGLPHRLKRDHFTAYLKDLLQKDTPHSTLTRYLSSLRRFTTFLEITYQRPPLKVPSLNEVTDKKAPYPEPDPHNNFLDRYQKFLESKDLSDSTVKNYLSDANHLLSWNDNHQKLSPKQLFSSQARRAYSQYLKQDQTAPSTASRRLSSLNKLTDFARQIGIIKKVPSTKPAAAPSLKPLSWFSRHSKKLKRNLPSFSLPQPLQGTAQAVKSTYHSYHALPFTPYLHLALLTLFTAALAVFGYQQIIKQATPGAAYPSDPQAPTRQLSFQGRLTDSAGTPITSSVNAVFKLYDDPDTGSQLYTSGTCSVDPDENGIFSILIGDGTCGSQIASSVFSENTAVYMEIDVGGETLDPRQQIATVAYALNTETVQGFPVAATESATTNTLLTMNESGEVILAEQSPTVKSVAGTFQIEGQNLTLATSQLSDGDITLNPDGSGQVFVTGGTTTENLIRITNANLTSGDLISGYVGNDTATGDLLSLSSGSTETDRFTVGQDGTGYFSGNLGIGTTSPSHTLDVSGTGRITGDFELDSGLIDVNDSTGTSGQLLSSTGSATDWVDSSSVGTDEQTLANVYSQAGNTVQMIAADGDIRFYNDASDELLFLDESTGNVGIGATGPEQKLEVSGQILSQDNFAIELDSSDSAGPRIKFGTTGSHNSLMELGAYSNVNNIDTKNRDLKIFSSTINPILYLQEDTGNVGIGTTNPQANLDIRDSDDQAQIRTYGYTNNSRYTELAMLSNGVGQLTTNTGALRISSGASDTYLNDDQVSIGYSSLAGTSGRLLINGNVGIGTTNPAAKLEVQRTDSANDVAIFGGNGSTATLRVNQTYSGTGRSAGLVLNANSSGQSKLQFEEDTQALWQLKADYSASDQLIFTELDGTNSDVLSLTKTGNIGIGTTNPLSALQIANTDYTDISDGLSFGDGDTGIFEQSDDNILFTFGGTNIWQMTADYFGRNTTGRPKILYEDSSATNPNLNPNAADNDTGIGSAGDNILSLIAGGTNSLNVTGSGNVGIGTTSPGASLDINSDSAATLLNLKAGTRELSITQSGGSQFIFDNNALYNFQTDSISRFYIGDSGNVGIGTTSPSALTDIGGGTADNVDGTNDLLVADDLEVDGTIYGNVEGSFTTNFSEGSVVFADASGNLTEDNANFYWDDASNELGIGTTEPNYKLDVQGLLYSSDGLKLKHPVNIQWTGASAHIIGPNAGASTLDINAKGNYDIRFLTSTNGESMRIKDSGNVGIGTTNPDADLHIKGSHTYLKLEGAGTTKNAALQTTDGTDTWYTGVLNNIYPSGYFGITQGGRSDLVIDTSGNIGIGTTSPSALLDVGGGTADNIDGTNDLLVADDLEVDGTIYGNVEGSFTTNFSEGSVVFADASGNLSEDNANFYWDDSANRLGLGTTSPSTALEIVGGLTASGDITAEKFLDVSNSDYYLDPASGGTSLTTAGNVGIGTTNPNVELGIIGDLRLAPSNLTSQYLEITSSGTTNLIHASDNNLELKAHIGERIFLDKANHYISFDTDSSEAMRIDQDGNIGIGTTSPSAELHLKGSDSSPQFRIVDSGNDGWDFGLVNDDMRIGTSGGGAGNVISLDYSSGNVGIGTTSPSSLLSVGSSSQFQVSSSGNIASIGGVAHSISDSSGTLLLDANTDSGINFSSDLGFNFYLDDDNDTSSSEALNIYDGGGSSVFEVSETQITSSVPHQFTSAGDVTMAYDLLFTNQTTSYIKSNAPLYLQAGESFESNDLTLQTYNSGDIVLDAGIGTTGGEGTISFYDSNLKGATDTTPINFSSSATAINDYRTNYTDETIIGAFNEVYDAATGASGGIWTDDGTFIYPTDAGSSSLAILDNGNVGIGTTSPDYTLDIKNSSVGKIQLANDDYVESSTGTRMRFDFGAGSGNTYGKIQVTDAGGTSSNNLLLQPESGYVGIGTTGPGATLDIQNSLGVPVLSTLTPYDRVAKFESSDGTANIVIEDSNSTSNGNTIGVTTDDMFFKTADTERVRIDSNGNVGIGTTSPGSYGLNVDLAGGIRTSGDITIDDNQLIYGANGLNYIDATAGSNAELTFRTGGTNRRMTIDSSGNVGIGTTNPILNLHVNSGIANIPVRFESTDTAVNIELKDSTGIASIQSRNDFRFYNSNYANELLRISSTGGLSLGSSYVGTDPGAGSMIISGNVGIGTTSPSGVLEIVTGNQNVGALSSFRLIPNTTSPGTDLRMGINNTDNFAWIEVAQPGTGYDRDLILNGEGGNVGIGTTGPGAKLEVVDSSVGGKVQFGKALGYPGFALYDTAGNDVVNFYTPSVNYGTMQGGSGGKLQMGIEATGSPELTFDDTGANPFTQFDVAGSNVMRLDHSGNVGIGTTSPTHLLDISGTGRITGDFELDSALLDKDDQSGTSGQVLSSTGSQIDWVDSTGVGTDDQTLYEVYQQAGNAVQMTAGNGDVRFYNDASDELLFLDESNGNVGIGTTGPESLLHVSAGNMQLDDAYGLRWHGAGLEEITEDTNYLHYSARGGHRFYMDNNNSGDTAFEIYGEVAEGTTTGVLVTVEDSGNVGIGTTGPQKQLEVYGTSPVLRLHDSAVDAWDIENLGGGLTFDYNGSEMARITASGNVGIGTTSPSQKLDISGGNLRISSTTGEIEINRGDGAYHIIGQGAGVANSFDLVAAGGEDTTIGNSSNGIQLTISDGSGGTLPSIYFANDIDTTINHPTGNALAFTTGGSETVRIITGNVGIGTTSPTALLDVGGGTYSNIDGTDDVGVKGDLEVLGTIYGAVGADDGTFDFLKVNRAATMSAQIDSDVPLRVTDTTDSELFRIESNGNVGIGTTSPNYELDVNGDIRTKQYVYFSANNSDNDWHIRNITGSGLDFVESGVASGRLYLEEGGNVGIGDVTPDHLLDIDGNLGLTASSYINWGDTDGSTGYGIRDNGGTMQFKNSSGSWSDFGSGTGSAYWALTDNVLHPKDEYGSVVDLTLGGTATSSANIHFQSNGQAYFAGNVGIGITDPGAKLDVVGSIFADGLDIDGTSDFSSTVDIHGTLDMNNSAITGAASLAINDPGGNEGITWGGSGAEIYVAPLDDSNSDGYLQLINDGGIAFEPGSDGTTEMVIESNGNVGIGTTSPDSPLHIFTTNDVPLTITRDGTGTSRASFINNNDTAQVGVVAGTARLTYGSISNNHLAIDSGGNVGIGTASPGHALQVGDSVSIADDRDSFVTGEVPSALYRSADTGASYPFLDAGNLVIQSRSSVKRDIAFVTGSTPAVQMIVDKNGNVGIGTTSPSQTLDVAGSFLLGDNSGTGQINTSDWDISTTGDATGLGSITADSTITFSGVGAGTDDSVLVIDGSGQLYHDEIDSRVWGSSLVDGSGSQNYLPKWSDSDTLTNSLLYDDGSNVGIGTIGPSTLLHIQGTSGEGSNPITFTIEETTDSTSWGSWGSSYARINFDSQDASGDGVGTKARIAAIMEDSAGATAGLGFFTENSTAGLTEKLRIAANGNVGIGTTSPDSILNITNTTKAKFNTKSDRNQLEFWSDLTPSYAASIGISSTESGLTNGDLLFQTYNGASWSDKMIITNGGNIGIGTTNPSETLDISGSLSATGDIIGEKFLDASNNNYLLDPAAGGTSLAVAGNIGIGTTSPTARLEIAGASSTISNDSGDITLNAASDQISFAGDNLGNLTDIYASGNVGIGTTSPSYKLDVFGDIRTASVVFKPQSSSSSTDEGAVYYDTDNDHLFLMDGSSTWHRLAQDMTQYSQNSSSVSNGSYIAVTHNQSTDDIIATGWIYDGSQYVEITDMASTAHNTYDPQLQGWYKAEESSGDLDNAEGTAANDLIDQGTPTYAQTGKVNNAIDLDGSSDYFCSSSDSTNCTDIDAFDPGSDSFSAGGWFKHNTISTNPDYTITKHSSSASIDTGDGADGSITVSTNTNINTTNLISGRSCADGGDAVNYSVSSLTSDSATLTTTPSTGCLATGDELLLINLQGTTSASVNTGNWEILEIQNISSNTITFTTNKVNYYGNGSTDDTNIGTTSGDQRVMLQRVPNYTSVTVNSSINFYPSGWDGVKDGVLMFKATGTVDATGTIHANARGYSGGSSASVGGEAFCGDNQGSGGSAGSNGSSSACGGGGGGGSVANSTQGTGGSGSATAGGAGGGGGTSSGSNYNQPYGASGGGGGYGSVGGYGSSYCSTGDGSSGGTNSSGDGGDACNEGTDGRSGGGGGAGTYGDSNLSDMFLGAGGGAGGDAGAASPGSAGGGAGIVYISADTITVSGNISANGQDGNNGTCYDNSDGKIGYGGAGGGGAGGSVFLSSDNLSLGTSLVTASGGTGGTYQTSGCYGPTGNVPAGNGGNGRVHLEYISSKTGSTSPTSDADQVSADAGGYKLYMDSDGDFVFGIDNNESGFPADSASTSGANYDDNEWHHVVIVKDKTNSIRLFVDGQEVGSDYSLASSTSISSSAPFYLGIDSDGSSNPWDGTIDEVFFYTRALSTGEIEELYQANSKFRIEQPDNNSVRLYNDSGATQNLRLDVTVFGADLAEWYTINNPDIQAGDLVANTGQMDRYGVPILKKATRKDKGNIIGGISTTAGKTLGLEKENRRLLGLAGRIPIKMDPNSPPLESGDYITASPNKPGLGYKAHPGDVIIGRSFHNWSPPQDNQTIDTLLTLISSPHPLSPQMTSPPESTLTLDDLGNLEISPSTTTSAKFTLTDSSTGRIIDRIAALGKAVIANLKTGSLQATTISTDYLSIAGQSIETFIQDTVKKQLANLQITSTKQLISPQIETDRLLADTVETDLIKPQNDSDLMISLQNSATTSGTLRVTGDTSISGKLAAQEIETSTISAKTAKFQQLEADTIKANQIEGVQASLDQIKSATIAAQTFINQLLAKKDATTQQLQDSANQTATASAQLLSSIENSWSATQDGSWLNISGLSSDFATISDYLEIQGTTQTQDLFVDGSLITSSLSTSPDDPDQTLYIQPSGTGSINLLAGLMIIDDTGQISINGDLKVKGSILADNLNSNTATIAARLNVGRPATASATASADLVNVYDESGQKVSSINASGSAKFQDLTTSGLTIAASATASADIQTSTSSNATIGTATLPAGQSQLTINNSQIKPSTLVYLTPISNTNNQVLYVSSKQAQSDTQDGQFTVAINQALQNNVKFNYWLIQTQDITQATSSGQLSFQN